MYFFFSGCAHKSQKIEWKDRTEILWASQLKLGNVRKSEKFGAPTAYLTFELLLKSHSILSLSQVASHSSTPRACVRAKFNIIAQKISDADRWPPVSTALVPAGLSDLLTTEPTFIGDRQPLIHPLPLQLFDQQVQGKDYACLVIPRGWFRGGTEICWFWAVWILVLPHGVDLCPIKVLVRFKVYLFIICAPFDVSLSCP